MQPFRLTALELLRAYRARQLSPVEAMASVIERVEAFEPHIAATWLYAPERALKAARASEARWMKDDPIGPLDGVPATVKDNIATHGDPTPLGTAASDMTPAEADAPPAAPAQASRRDSRTRVRLCRARSWKRPARRASPKRGRTGRQRRARRDRRQSA